METELLPRNQLADEEVSGPNLQGLFAFLCGHLYKTTLVCSSVSAQKTMLMMNLRISNWNKMEKVQAANILPAKIRTTMQTR